ncbi:MAG: phospholipase D family protein [Candidatus Puniceispirillum sp.]|nr:phospholipase D family protein [Candidatus Puniceispirillum sp.]
MSRRRVSLLSPKWTISSILAAVITLLVYEAIRQLAFPIIVDEKSGVRMEACFTPGGQCQNKIVRAIDAAKSEILVMSYSFTARPIAEALINAQRRGIKVHVIADDGQRERERTQLSLLATQGVSITFDKTVAISHNKVMIIDGKTVVTGSYNWTNAAQFRNAENILFIESPELAKQYKKNWEERMRATQGSK